MCSLAKSMMKEKPQEDDSEMETETQGLKSKKERPKRDKQEEKVRELSFLK